MQYLGGKSRLARKIVDVIRQRAPETVGVVEPFCGGFAVTERLCAWRPTLACDAFPGLIGMAEAVRRGLRLPVDGVTDEQYQAFKAAAKAGDRSPSTVAVGFGLSFGGMWYSNNTRVVHDDKRDYAVYWNHWADRLASCQNLWLYESDYRDLTDLAGPGLTFYCDPPYRLTEGYETGYFDSTKFDQVCWLWRSKGARVFVSEFQAPWTVVAEFPRPVAINSLAAKRTCVDRLYEVLP